MALAEAVRFHLALALGSGWEATVGRHFAEQAWVPTFRLAQVTT